MITHLIDLRKNYIELLIPNVNEPMVTYVLMNLSDLHKNQIESSNYLLMYLNDLSTKQIHTIWTLESFKNIFIIIKQ